MTWWTFGPRPGRMIMLADLCQMLTLIAALIGAAGALLAIYCYFCSGLRLFYVPGTGWVLANQNPVAPIMIRNLVNTTDNAAAYVVESSQGLTTNIKPQGQLLLCWVIPAGETRTLLGLHTKAGGNITLKGSRPRFFGREFDVIISPKSD